MGLLSYKEIIANFFADVEYFVIKFRDFRRTRRISRCKEQRASGSISCSMCRAALHECAIASRNCPTNRTNVQLLLERACAVKASARQKLNRKMFAVKEELGANNITGAQLRAARAFLKLSQRELSTLSKVSQLTIVRMESRDGLIKQRPAVVLAVLRVLRSRGIRFFAFSTCEFLCKARKA